MDINPNCFSCNKPVGEEGVMVSTPVCPVRVHRECEEKFKNQRDSLVKALWGM